MPRYSFHDYTKAWLKSIFGLFVALAFWWAFNSIFLGVLAFAFLCFIPLEDEDSETIVNRLMFMAIMFVLLLWAFGFGNAGSDTLGLGLSLGNGQETASLFGFNMFGSASTGTTGSIMFIAFGLCLLGYAIMPRGDPMRNILLLVMFVLFIVIMFTTKPWDWNFSAILFVGIWFISLIQGIFETPQARAQIGTIILIVSFVLYAQGVGTNDTGAAFFGQWWPTVHNLWSSVSEPLYNAVQPLYGTITNAWNLMTNPVGYATQIMNGTYADNPGGLSGVHGVDIVGMDVGNAYVLQPFMITATLKNNGAATAGAVTSEITIDTSKTPVYGTIAGNDVLGKDVKDIDTRLGISKSSQNVGKGASETVAGYLDKQDMRQVIFYSNNGIACKTVNDFDLRKKTITMKIATTYNYQSDSHVTVQFIKQSEWDRLTQTNALILKDVTSEYSSAPVKFPIGTAGLKQPIIAASGQANSGQPFNLGLRLDAEGLNTQIENVSRVEMTIPPGFELDGGDACTPKPSSSPSGSTGGKIVWDASKFMGTDGKTPLKGSKILFCRFKALSAEKIGGAATKTFEVRAHAEYQVKNWKNADLSLQFGGVCCQGTYTGGAPADCLKGQVCNSCVCVPDTGNKETGCNQGQTTTKPDCETGDGSRICVVAGGQPNNPAYTKPVSSDYKCPDGKVCWAKDTGNNPPTSAGAGNNPASDTGCCQMANSCFDTTRGNCGTGYTFSTGSSCKADTCQ
jgi:hypothetical protein